MARIKSKEDFMKRKIILILLGAFLTTSVFANGLKGKIPADMGKSLIIESDKVFGTDKTINDIFAREPSSDITITTEGKKMYVDMDCGLIQMKLTITFSGLGTCYISKLYYNSPLTFQEETLTCSSPYNDPSSYGEILGFFSSSLKWFYD